MSPPREPGDDFSAPGQVELLEPLWVPLSEERCRQLSFKWVDMTVRRMLAESFAKSGRPHQAGVLRGLPPIRDIPTLRGAQEALKGLEVPFHPMDLAASYFNTVATLKKLDDSMDISECCFLTVMASRFTYNDDRSVDEMRRDLLTASRAS
jgi:hypothetical protein